MTMLRQLTWGLLATGALTLMACSEQAVAPNDGPVSGDMLAAKGGGGKPGGGGGGGGGGGTVASAEIAFHYNGTLYVMNADGAARTALLTNGCSTSSSSWAPVGNGTTAAPFRILNWGNCASEAFTVADVDTTGGSVHVRNIQHIHIAGDWWDTGNAGSPHYGQPAWKPGTGDEVVMSAWYQANAQTNEWVSALYIFAASDLPNPTLNSSIWAHPAARMPCARRGARTAPRSRSSRLRCRRCWNQGPRSGDRRRDDSAGFRRTRRLRSARLVAIR